MESNVFYVFSSEGYLTTTAVTPDYFENAVKNNLHGPDSGRQIHHQLLYKEYIHGDNTFKYPSYIDFPVVYRQFDGKRLRDMLDMRYDGNCFLISDRMKRIFKENEFTGWETYPVLLFDKKGHEIKGYSGFTVIGRGGQRKYLLPKQEVDKMVKEEKAKYIEWDISQWDGTDIFRIDPNYVMITDRVKKIMTQNKIEAPSFWSTEEHFQIIGSPRIEQ